MRVHIKDIRPHSMIVHFTSALYPVSTFLMFLFLITKNPAYATTHYHTLLLATASVPFSYLSGVIEWKRTYKSAWVRIFVSKLRLGALLFLIGLSSVFLHMRYPNVLEVPGDIRVA